MQGLHLRLRDIGQYLQKVLDGELPVNHAILGNLQDVFNLLPNLATAKAGSQVNGSEPIQFENTELARAMSVKTNDQLMTIYISSLIRSITAFHDLIDNKIQNRRQQEEKEEKEAKKEEEKEEKTGAANKENKKADNEGAEGGESKENQESAKDKGKKKES